MTDGCVYILGAGPGDPGLLTLRGREVLEAADAVVYDYLSADRLLRFAPTGAERMYVGKRAAAHTLSQEKICGLLVELGKQGKQVVRLKGGDPYVFGRGGEEAIALAEAGVRFEEIPGVTAGIAAAAYAGIPVTHRGIASNVGFVTGHETPDKVGTDLNYEALAGWRGTLAFYMGVRNVGVICENLITHGLDADTPAALIRWGTTARQATLIGTVANIAEKVAAANFKPPAVILIGKVVTLRDKLNWFETRPLFGRRIVVTRARAQASGLATRLERLGAEVIELPTIEIRPPEDDALAKAVGTLDSFDWIVLTSANAVDALMTAIAATGKDARALASSRLCVIGPATAARLAAFGLRPDAQPATYVSDAVPDAMAAAGSLDGVKVLYPRANIAPEKLRNALTARGAEVTDVIAYRTIPVGADPEIVAELFGGEESAYCVTFTSSSTVKNFFAIVNPERVRAAGATLASIGPATSETLREFGFEPTIEADPHTVEGLIDALVAGQEPRRS